MSRARRKTLIRIVEGAAVGLVLLDLVLYFAVVGPLRSMRASAEVEYAAVRDRVRDAKGRVVRLEKFKAAVPGAEAQLEDFLKAHVPRRRQGFSRAARLVRMLSEDSKVRLSGVSYKLDPADDDPLARLGLEVEVEGTFANLMNFVHALETNDEFASLRDFSFEPGEDRTIALRVGADLYLMR
jgi:Tfp pilus assembly protein PilO